LKGRLGKKQAGNLAECMPYLVRHIICCSRMQKGGCLHISHDCIKLRVALFKSHMIALHFFINIKIYVRSFCV